MRFGQIGFGSMGKRRARDLQAAAHEIVAFDVREDRVAQARDGAGLTVAGGLDELLSSDLDALVISTPPDTHEELIGVAFDAGLPFFIEASIEVPSASWMADRQRATGVAAVPSSTWRFHPAARALREHIQSSEILSAHHLYAGYLPAWHPYEHYSEFYAGRELATCAAREMVPFELDLLTWLFGPVAAVRADRRRVHEWTTDIVDSYLLELEYEAGVYGTLVVELHQPATARVTRVGAADGAQVADYGAGVLAAVDSSSRSTHSEFEVSWEAVYREEILAFVAALSGAAFPKTWADDRHLYDVLIAAEESARTAQPVRIGDHRTP